MRRNYLGAVIALMLVAAVPLLAAGAGSHLTLATATTVEPGAASGWAPRQPHNPTPQHLGNRDRPQWVDIAHPKTNDDRLACGTCFDASNGLIYMYGGSTNGTVGSNLTQCDRYDPNADQWTSVAPMLQARDWLKGLCVNGKCYVCGGMDNSGNAMSECEVYDPSTNVWTAIKSMPIAELAPEEVVFDSLIYVAGGYDVGTNVQIYNTLTNAWTTGTNMNTPGFMGDFDMLGDTIYELGDFQDMSTTIGKQIRYGVINRSDPTKIAWSFGPTLGPRWSATGRADGPTVQLNGKFYAWGGFDGMYIPPAQAESVGYIFDPATQLWDSMPLMEHCGCRCCYGVADPVLAVLYNMGGCRNPITWAPPNNWYAKVQYAVAHDFGVSSILVPSSDQDSGYLVTPTADVNNYGLNPETNVWVRYWLDDGSSYTDSLEIPSLIALHDTIVSFKPVTLVSRGYHTASCSTELAVDLLNGNDKTTKIFKVEVRDVGCIAIANPSGTVDSGQIEIPIGVVYNFGTAPAGFWTMMKIWDSNHPEIPGYLDAESTYLEAGANANVTFANWTAMPRGSLTAKCSTMYQYELHHEDDARTSQILVRVIDAGVNSITWPTGTMVPKGNNVPKGTVTNYGTNTEDVPATFNIFNDSGVLVYSSTITQTLTPNQTASYVFTNWNAPAESNYVGQLEATLTGDVNSANNQMMDTFTVFNGTRDVGVDKVLIPGTLQDTLDFAPSIDVTNYGSLTETFYSYMKITFLGNNKVTYYDSVPVASIPPSTAQQFTLPSWTGHKLTGSYSAVAWTLMSGDQNPANDTTYLAFSIQGNVISLGWTVKSNVPPGPKNKQVKDGAQLAYFERGGNTDSTFIFCLKGNNTLEYYKYAIPQDLWRTEDSIPLVSQGVGKAKRVKKGAVLATGTDGMIYAAKGNSSLEWWQYNEMGDTANGAPWTEKALVPFGTHNLSEGADAVGVSDSNLNYIYFLKGSNTQEFYRYDIANNVWQTLAPAPLGYTGRKYKDGSNLAYDPNTNMIFCLKGQYNEFFAYSVAGDSWLSELPQLPTIGLSGKPKYAKSGAALECINGNICCTKGNNTLEFFKYNEGTGAWTWDPQQQYQIGGGKKVNLGGALAWASYAPHSTIGALYSTKGNGTTEFYEYGPMSPLTFAPSNKKEDAVDNSKTTLIAARLSVTPNPFNGSTNISYSVPKAGPVSIRLYDATGSLVTTVTEGYCAAGANFTTHLDASKLARGIYLLKFTSQGCNSTHKLILE